VSVMRHIPSVAKVAIAILVLGVTFAAGFWGGVQLGVHQFALLEGSVKASLLAGELRVLRTGNNEKLIGAKEIELDGEIVKAFRFRDEGHPWMLWPHASAYEHERYLRNVARYRKEYPSPARPLEFGGDESLKREMRKYTDEVAERTRELIEHYGK